MVKAPVPSGILLLGRKMSVVLVATNLEAGFGNMYFQDPVRILRPDSFYIDVARKVEAPFESAVDSLDAKKSRHRGFRFEGSLTGYGQAAVLNLDTNVV